MSRLALGYVGLAVVIFGVCIVCLVASFVSAPTRSERNQVQWILLAALISTLPIGYLILQTLSDPSNLGRDSTAWLMFGVSLLFTLAYAMSITRYKLMQVEEIINRSVVYFVLSVTAGLVYSGVLLLGGKVIGDQLLSGTQTSGGAMVAALTAIVVLILSELARERFQKAIDRRFYREKYNFDQAMGKMRLAIGSLVDRETLGRRLLEAASEVLRLEWGAIYLGDSPRGPFRLVACDGPAPDEQVLAGDNPLIARLRTEPAIRVPHAMSSSTASDPATDAMIALGGRRPMRWRRTASWPACSCSARSGAGCPTRTRRSPSSARSARSRRWRSTRRGSSRPWRSSTMTFATRSTRSPSSSGAS